MNGETFVKACIYGVVVLLALITSMLFFNISMAAYRECTPPTQTKRDIDPSQGEADSIVEDHLKEIAKDAYQAGYDAGYAAASEGEEGDSEIIGPEVERKL